MFSKYLFSLVLFAVFFGSEAKADGIECSEDGSDYIASVKGSAGLEKVRIVKTKDSKIRRLHSGEYAETGGQYKVVRVTEGVEEIIGYIQRGMGAHITHWEHQCAACGNRYWPMRLPPWARNNPMGYWEHEEVCGAVKAFLAHYIECHELNECE